MQELKENTIQLYPNPTTGVVRIDGLVGASAIEVYDLSGVLVAESKSSNASALVDLSGLSNALYIIIVQDDLGVRTSRVIKQ